MSNFLAYILTSVGLTVVVVWPESGLVAYLREKVLRRALPSRLGGILDCYTCFGFWAGLVMSPVWWMMDGRWVYFFGCLMVPPIFWVLQQHNDAGQLSQDTTGTTAEDVGKTLKETRLAICRMCDHFRDGMCDAYRCCPTTWQRFLNSVHSTCPKRRF